MIGSYDDTSADRQTDPGYIGVEISSNAGWRLDDFGGGETIGETPATFMPISRRG
jgi:hypothetical protein